MAQTNEGHNNHYLSVRRFQKVRNEQQMPSDDVYLYNITRVTISIPVCL